MRPDDLFFGPRSGLFVRYVRADFAVQIMRIRYRLQPVAFFESSGGSPSAPNP